MTDTKAPEFNPLYPRTDATMPPPAGFVSASDYAAQAARIDALEAALVKADELADAAAHIRHWHDAMRDNSGMVVSAEHVRILWKVLAAYNEAKNARTALNDKTPTDTPKQNPPT